MKVITIMTVLATIAVNRLEAAVLYTFSENASGVQLGYSGSLDTSGLRTQAALSAEGTYIDILGVAAPGQQLYDFQNFQRSPLLPELRGVSSQFSADDISFSWNLDTLDRRYYAPSAWGDTFGFYIFERSGIYVTWLNLPFGYISESPINGGMVFEGETLSSMELSPSESFRVFLPGGENISGVVVVPEPQFVLPFVLATLGTLGFRCRRQPS